MFDVARASIFVTVAGSHAHGTAGEGSDVDLRGVCVAPFAVRVSYRQRFEQFEGPLDAGLRALLERALLAHPTFARALSNKLECVIFDVAKFVRLAAEGNPNALESLFSDERDWLHATPAWHVLHAARAKFLSRSAQHTFLGYGLAQLKRIRTHRAWLLEPPRGRPARSAFGLPEQSTLSREDRDRIEQAVADKLRSFGIDELDMPRATRIALAEKIREFWSEALSSSEQPLDEGLETLAATSLGLPRALVRTLASERRYRAALRHYQAYERWKSERNPARAELEARFGYDTKHAMHLVRLMRMGFELLESGSLRVRRPDATELVAIREGALTYEELVLQAEELERRMRAAAERSPLPEDVDHDVLDALLCEVLEMERAAQ